MTGRRFDPLGALTALTEAGVDFVVIGGIAGRLHGSTIVTNDLDICYDRAPENLQRLASMLTQAEATQRGVADDVPIVTDASTLEAGDTFTLDTDFGPLDILGSPAGVADFGALARNATQYEVGGITVKVASLDDLITMKLAAGLPKDLIEAEVLGALRDEIDGLG